jgi:hypothetical protein
VVAGALVAMLIGGAGVAASASSAQPGASHAVGGRPTMAASGCGNNGADKRYPREEVLRRARSWLSGTQSDTPYDPVNYFGDYVPYSQSVCHTNSYGSYRQDCSGFVSMAWGLGGAGDAWWTGNLLPQYSAGHTVAIAQSALAPGDALLRHVGDESVDHVALFVRWAGGGALVYEQTGATHRPRVAVWSMSTVALYTPIRYALLASTLVAGQRGALNLVRTGGELDWYTHTGWTDGTTSWDRTIRSGTGFNEFDKILADGHTIYGIYPDGTMKWYSYDFAAGWDPASGTAIGWGWNAFKFVVSAGDGIFYGVTYDGALQWYRYTGVPGQGGGWAHSGRGRVVGTGWQAFRALTGVSGTLYAVRHDGTLQWYRYVTPYDGSGTGWAPASGQAIGSGWVGSTCVYQEVAAVGDGRIYAVGRNGVLHWWHHLDPDNGSASWAPVAGCGDTVGTGWL